MSVETADGDIVEFVPTVVKGMAAAFDRVRTPARGLVVLIYHRVGGRTPVRVDLPTPAFDEQMELLASRGRILALDDAVDRLIAGDDLSDFVVVTFDDGTADFVDDAVPILERHGVPATLYVATNHIENAEPFPDDGQPASWPALADALTTGFVTIGSHTHTHALLDRLPAPEIADELDRSISLIGERLGVVAEHFAYPKALAPSATADVEVRARFRSAALAGTRANPVGADVHCLARTPIQTTDNRRWFEHKVAGGMALEDDLRRLTNRRRYAGAMS